MIALSTVEKPLNWRAKASSATNVREALACGPIFANAWATIHRSWTRNLDKLRLCTWSTAAWMQRSAAQPGREQAHKRRLRSLSMNSGNLRTTSDASTSAARLSKLLSLEKATAVRAISCALNSVCRKRTTWASSAAKGCNAPSRSWGSTGQTAPTQPASLATSCPEARCKCGRTAAMPHTMASLTCTATVGRAAAKELWS
mmetsp:Transcript_22372/g.64167  ORF Transcript_22372/g.64167 Transcript_22372/m.64167 type:complete len:201 (-) Transcript_22372:848-1450(-)